MTKISLDKFIKQQISCLEKFRFLWARGMMDSGWAKEASQSAWQAQLAAYSKREDSSERPHLQDCKHPPERLYSWFAFNHETEKSDIQCVRCCNCGSVLKGWLDTEEEIR